MIHVSSLIRVIGLGFLLICVPFIYSLPIQTSSPTVIVFVERKVLDMFFNWMIYFTNSVDGNVVKNLTIFCMDQISRMELLRSGIYCRWALHQSSNPSKKQQFGDIWLQRMIIISKMLSSGKDIILSDIDAIWVKNPLPYLSQFNNSDIVASRGFWPFSLFEKWGSCVCMGFIYVKSSNFSIDLFNEIESVMRSSYSKAVEAADDQVAINEVLERRGIIWDSEMTVVNSTRPNFGRLKNWTSPIVLLPHHYFVRKCYNLDFKRSRTELAFSQMKELTKSGMVVHCKFPKGFNMAKKTGLKRFALWKLLDHWKSYASVASSCNLALEKPKELERSICNMSNTMSIIDRLS